MKNELKIFISYSHQDEEYVTGFEKYFEPIKNKYNLKLWHDTKNKAGDKFQQKIDKNLNDSDIILLFVSANFFSSDACKKELKESLKLRNEKNAIIVPIILSTCAWKETELKDLLCVPKDGKPVSDFEDKNKAWEDVSNSIKKHIEELNQINNLKIEDSFKKFLESCEILEKAHQNKQNVSLEDIFVSPQLECFDELRESEETTINYQELEENITDYKAIVIAGDDQSGKTTLCKRLFLALKQKRYLPVYIFDKDKKLQGKIKNKIEKEFKEQYNSENIEYSKIMNRIIPIIDNFYLAKQKENHIKNLSEFKFSILIIDDIYGLNIKDKDIIKKHKHFRIKEFLPTLRNDLIQKWLQLTDKDSHNNDSYKELDEKTKLIDTTLGKIIGNGIVPSYPFFILTILSTYETVKPLDENITSQGHCYQALIYIALRKEIDNKDIDIYLNFMNVIAYKFFETQKKEFNEEELNSFITEYKEKYNLPFQEDNLLSKLIRVNILKKDSFGNISFKYDYLYFYFVAKYIAEHIDENKKTIDNIIANLHKNENAYITIFISHHSKDNYVLDEVVLNAMCLFDKYESATLEKKEISFLDNEVKNIIDASLPKPDESSEQHRAKQLEIESQIEESKNKKPLNEDEQDIDPLDLEIRRSIKTVEVMGRIIRNRAGSLENDRLKQIFENGMNVHLRFLKLFLELMKDKDQQEFIIDFIRDRLNKTVKESKEKISEQELKKIAEKIFWNLNFQFLYVVINKTIHSLGSDNLTNITNNVCDKINTPASFLIKHGILMWYSKNLQIDSLYKKTTEKTFSDTAKKLINYFIVSYCYMHKINYKDRQKLEQNFGFSSKKLLLNKPQKPTQ